MLSEMLWVFQTKKSVNSHKIKSKKLYHLKVCDESFSSLYNYSTVEPLIVATLGDPA